MPIAHLEAPEFIKRVIDGERDFTGIRLTDRDVVGDTFTFIELSEYLKTQDLKKNPIILNEAELQFVRAGGLYMPYTKARQASFKDAYFMLANFEFSDFTRSSFFSTNLAGANCANTNFSNCYFKMTAFSQTNLRNADLRNADLTSASDLSTAIDLAHAKFGRTMVSTTEQRAILNALKQRADFDTINTQSYFKIKT